MKPAIGTKHDQLTVGIFNSQVFRGKKHMLNFKSFLHRGEAIQNNTDSKTKKQQSKKPENVEKKLDLSK